MYTKQRFLVVLIGAALASFAGAQSMPYQPPDSSANYGADNGYDNTAPAQNDPPSRVARLSYVTGEVSFAPAGEDDWVQAQTNRPIVTGDKLFTDADAHAELQLGGTTVQLDRSSNFDFLNLDDQLAQMELTQGSLDLGVHRLRGNESYEIDTPTIAFVANRVGDYRIDVDPNGGTTVTARRGGGDAIGEGGKRITVEEGQSVRFNDSQLNDYQVNQIGAPDQFDNYARERVARYDNAPPPRYVSADVVGYQDLDQYGSWEDAPEYGHVWYPREVAADWAPYQDGHWAWIDPWGWTWVDNAPWGYAPFHYGRWAYVDSRWGWVPGPVDVEPVYAPALVAFVGGGVSVGVSFGGPVGWFALGPHDVYFPGYRCGHDYFTRVNVGNSYVNTTVVNNYYGAWSHGSVNYANIRYANRDAPRAVTAMPANAFVSGSPVRASAVAVNRETFANARVMARPTVMPTRESLVAGRGRAPAPPAAAVNRTVVAANRPPAPVASFAQRQAVLQKNGGQPLTRNQLHTLAAQQGGNARAAAPANVRVVGTRGNAVPARAAAEANNRGPNNGRVAGPPNQSAQVEANTRAQNEANARAQNNARVAGQTPSRAPEMNRSPERANAQYMRSAGYAHQGVVPGSERATNAQQNRANGDERAQARAQQQNRGPNRGNAPQQGQQSLNSARFAHGQEARGQNARGAPEQAQRQTAAANARDNAQRNAATTRENAARSNAEQARSRDIAQQNAHDQARAQQNAQANARAQANERAQANARAQANERAQANARAAESAQQARTAQNSRAQEQQRAMAEQRQAQARSQASARAAESARTAQNNRVQQQQQQRAMTEQRRAPPQPSYTQRAPQQPQRSEPPRQQQQVAHAPPPQQQQRQAPQQHQVARSQQQPQQRAPKDKKKDTNEGGGG